MLCNVLCKISLHVKHVYQLTPGWLPSGKYMTVNPDNERPYYVTSSKKMCLLYCSVPVVDCFTTWSTNNVHCNNNHEKYGVSSWKSKKKIETTVFHPFVFCCFFLVCLFYLQCNKQDFLELALNQDFWLLG